MDKIIDEVALKRKQKNVFNEAMRQLREVKQHACPYCGTINQNSGNNCTNCHEIFDPTA